jgi:ribosomal protein L14E/L6E/L27E
MEITTGAVVVSLAGHDKGGLFAVTGIIDQSYVLIADGKSRKTEKPKKKKLKHLKALGRLTLPEPGAASNRGLRRALREFRAAVAAVAEGGIYLV